MAQVCYRCGKQIKGMAIRHVPPLMLDRMGLDFCKSFHPKCHQKEETDAAALLNDAGPPKDAAKD